MKVSVFAPTVLKDDGKSDFFVQILFKEPIKALLHETYNVQYIAR